MTGFSYQAYDASGSLVRGEIAAQSREEALAGIRARGLIPVRAETTADRKATFSATIGERQARLPRAVVARIFRELAVMLGAGLRIDQALGIAERLVADKRQRPIITHIKERVREGAPLSAAFAQHPASFQPFEIAIFRNGEVQGDLAAAAGMAADILERTLAVRTRLVSAMIYPAILAIAAVGAILIVTLVLAPTILPMFERSGQSPPAAFAALIGFSDLLRNWWWLILVMFGAAAAGLVRAWRHEGFRRRVDAMLLNTPVVGPALAQNETARAARTLAALLKAGAPLPNAIGEAAGVLNSPAFHSLFLEAQSRVRRGEALSAALAGATELPPTLIDFIVIGEQTGRLPAMLSHAADHAEAAATRAIDRVMTALPPLMTLVMGTLVGALIAVVLSAILDANELLVG